MRRKLVPWILACAVGIGLAVTWAKSGDEPRERERRSSWTYVSDDSGGSRAWLGAAVEEETERAQGGARVTNVAPDSPAERAGLLEGDVIVRIDGKSVYGPRGLRQQVRSHEPGQSVGLEIVRDGDDQKLTVELGERHGFEFFGPSGGEGFAWSGDELRQNLEDAGRKLESLHVEGPHGWAGLLGRRPRLGVQLVETTPELREHLGGHADVGVLVGKVLKGMPAEMAGIRVGDLIESVDGKPIEGAGDLVDAIQSSDGGVLQVEVVRDGRAQTIEVTLPDLSEDEKPTGPRA